MNNQESPADKKIKELEVALFKSELEKEELILINSKLGHSIKLMSEFHLSQKDKEEIAAAIDSSTTFESIGIIYETYFNKFYNKSLGDESADFQWSKNFSDNLRFYFVVSLGYDPIYKIGDNISIISNYFSLENKIRNTPDAAQRNPMVEKLMKDRPSAVAALDNVINIVNSFNQES